MTKEEENNHYDVIIVGGGPGGSTAARTVKQYDNSLDVILFDEGTPRAERDVNGPDSTDAAGQLRYWLDEMPIWVQEIFKDNTEKNLDDALFYSPNNEIRIDEIDRFEQTLFSSFPTKNKDGLFDGFGITFDRPQFDMDLLDEAENQGVEVELDTRVTDVATEWDNGSPIHTVKAVEKGELTADYVILADGPKRKVTMKTLEQFTSGPVLNRIHPLNDNQHTAAQYYVSPSEDDSWPEKFEQSIGFFWGYIPGHTAYPWVFPLKDGVYEIGLTRPTEVSSPDWFKENNIDQSEWVLLDDDDESYPGDDEILSRFYTEVIGSSSTLEEDSLHEYGKHDGKETYVISSMRPFDSPVGANIAVVGGAGGFTSAFHEGGDHTAIYTGILAGELIGKEDESFADFNNEWKKRYGYEIFANVAFAEMIEGYKGKDFDLLFESGDNFGLFTSSLPDMAHTLDNTRKYFTHRLRTGEDYYLCTRNLLPPFLPRMFADSLWNFLGSSAPIKEKEYIYPRN